MIKHQERSSIWEHEGETKSVLTLQSHFTAMSQKLRNSLVPSKVRSSKRKRSYDLREELQVNSMHNDETSLVMGKIFVNA